MDPKIIAIVIFGLTYALLIWKYHLKMFIVGAAAGILIITGILSPAQALDAIDWNVILLYYGMLFVSEAFLYSRMPDFLASLFAGKAKHVSTAMIILCALAGVLSMALENVAVVLLLAPIALVIAKKCDIPLAPLFIGIAISSNLQGAATLIGDPPSMLLAGYAKLGFNDFFWYQGKPGIFFAVQAAFLVSLVVLFFVYRRFRTPMPTIQKEKYLTIVPTIISALLVVSLIIVSSFFHDFEMGTGLVCAFFGVVSFVWHVLHDKKLNLKEYAGKLDWQTGVFLMGIFVLVRSLSTVGLMEDIANLVMAVAGTNPFAVFMLVVGFSVLISAVVDNVPFLVAMLPVITIISAKLGISPYPLFVGLLIGASIGGNITPIGASANIVAMGIVRKNGGNTNFGSFMKIGLPFTLASVAAACVFIWFVEF